MGSEHSEGFQEHSEGFREHSDGFRRVTRGSDGFRGILSIPIGSEHSDGF